MRIDVSRETERPLADAAKRLGISVDAPLERNIEERTALARPSPELPVWHLGAAGAFHRRDFFDDAR